MWPDLTQLPFSLSSFYLNSPRAKQSNKEKPLKDTNKWLRKDNADNILIWTGEYVRYFFFEK